MAEDRHTSGIKCRILFTHVCGKLHYFLVSIRYSQGRMVVWKWDDVHTNSHALTATMMEHSKYSIPLFCKVKKTLVPYTSINPAVSFTWHNNYGNICQMCGIQCSLEEVGKRLGGSSWVPACTWPSEWDFVQKDRKRIIFVSGRPCTLLFYFPGKCHS